MEMELLCPDCNCRFSASAETTAEDIVRRMIDEGPWYALGAGACFGDMIHTALEHRGRIVCPECGVGTGADRGRRRSNRVPGAARLTEDRALVDPISLQKGCRTT